MFKLLSKIYLISSLLLIGIYSQVFGIDFSQALSQAEERSLSLGSIFEGKSSVSNLYAKALKLVKDREVDSTVQSLDSMISLYADCPGVSESDFIHILYNSNLSFRTVFVQIFPKGISYPSKNDIEKSYQKLLACRTTTQVDTSKVIASQYQIEQINNEITDAYLSLYANSYMLSTIDQTNFWSDLFWNGDQDDSDFDLLVDINAVGKLMFEEFKESPEVFFYKLPTIDSPSTQAWSDLSTLDDQNVYQVGGGWWSSSITDPSLSVWWSASSLVSDERADALSSSSVNASVSDNESSVLIAEDKEIQNLISHTTSSTIAGSALVLWNQCLSGDVAEHITISEEQVQFMEPEAYIEGITDFIVTANTEDIINNTLADVFHTNYPLSPWWSSSDSGYASYIANVFAEKAFGDPAPGSCEYSCQSIDDVKKKAQCEVSCVSSCIQQCDIEFPDNLTVDSISQIQNKALCVSDCTCFLIAWPNGKWREKVEDMFRIKFCKVPVQTKTLQAWKKVFSIQAIFQEISDVLQGLRDSGEMVKFSQRKEFLDGSIKTKFADSFVFQILVWFKPVFQQKSVATETKEKEQATKDLNAWILNINTSNPSVDDYNKYIVIADPIKTNAEAEFANSLDDVQQNVETFRAADSIANKLLISLDLIEDVTSTQQNKMNTAFMNEMTSFLKQNQLFWEYMRQTLRDMNDMSSELVEKIENS